MGTDRERAWNLVKGAFEPMLTHSPALRMLADLVAKNQNGPPDGQADGSLTRLEWDRLSGIVNGLNSARTNLDAFLAEVALRPPETEIKHPVHTDLPGARIPTRGDPKPSG
jgi:hypothetical protein